MGRKLKTDSENLVHTLQQLLQEELASSQEALQLRLKKHGFTVTQSTISRLLRRLGASKGVDESGKVVYRLVKTDLLSLLPSVRASIKDLITDVTHNEAMIVVHTRPGSAGLVGGLLDNQPDLPILGNVAGDDTIFIAPQSTAQIKKIFMQIKVFLLGAGTD